MVKKKKYSRASNVLRDSGLRYSRLENRTGQDNEVYVCIKSYVCIIINANKSKM